MEAITRAGGSVSYDWEWSNGKPTPGATACPWPNWVVKRLGPDFCGRVVAVHLAGMKAFDAPMVHIGHLARLEHLDLSDGGVSGDALVHLKKLTSLETLLLPELPRGDDDLGSLASLTGLKRLGFSGERVTNKGLARLSGLRQLESLHLTRTSITTLEPLRGFARLKELDVTGSPIDDDGLRALESIPSLELLSLGYTLVTDAGMAIFDPVESEDSESLRDARRRCRRTDSGEPTAGHAH